MWPDRRLIELVGLDLPIVQAPMAGAMDWELAAAVSEAGGLGSLPCAMLTADKVREQVEKIRVRTQRPININFFCHAPPERDAARETAWRARVRPYYAELGLDPDSQAAASERAPFDAAMCEVVETLRPEVVSFHFGLPETRLLERVKRCGALVFSSATTVSEARYLARHGADVVVAQGCEAGGHRGMFLASDVATQVGTLALLPQVVDAVTVPVIAAGGITDARGIVAAFALGACGVQMGTAYLFAREAKISAPLRAALGAARDDGTALTNVITGRPARGAVNRLMREHGPMSAQAPSFPLAADPLQPLRAKAEAQGCGDFSPLWMGQAARLAREGSAADITHQLAAEASALLHRLGRASATPA
jgi:nitronate monooxygenase